MKDEELCGAILETEQGKADVLGGGVFKKRPHQNCGGDIFFRKRGRIFFFFFLYTKHVIHQITYNELGFVFFLSIFFSFLKNP